MSSRSEWSRCREMSRRQFRQSGGCFWDLDPDSPGHSLRIPNGTAFQIHLEGSKSHKFVHGECRDGEFVVDQIGEMQRFTTANRAVHAVRKAYAKATNAYLYISFRVDDRFVLADELRVDREFGVPLAEALAFQLAKTLVKTQKKQLKASEVDLAAEDLLDGRPEIVESAREMLEVGRR